ncbi:MAG: NAD(P)-dependent oxidoreductase [Nanoarchaeota archaeon]|nr:NAD(P)-dependent oxidoreductase [Nanoarchaeota archaeon]
MKILITGNGGYLGVVITKKALDEGHEVIGFDFSVQGNDFINSLKNNPRFKQVVADLRDSNKIASLIKECDIVLHLAALVIVDSSTHRDKEMEEINRDVPIQIAQLCSQLNKKMIFASTCSVYGIQAVDKMVSEEYTKNPTTSYARTKSEAEEVLKNMHNVIICRLATAYGPSPRMRYDLFINEMTREAFNKKQINLFDSEIWRCYIHTEDIARALLFIIDKNNLKYNIYNIGSNEQNLRKIDIVNMIKKELKDVKVNIIENKKDIRNYRVDFSRLKNEGFNVEKSIHQGIREMINYLKKV